jgi:hypothetical protein
MRRQGHRDPLRRPRGVLLLGVPGTGKAQPSQYPCKRRSMWHGNCRYRPYTSSLRAKTQAPFGHAVARIGSTLLPGNWTRSAALCSAC